MSDEGVTWRTFLKAGLATVFSATIAIRTWRWMQKLRVTTGLPATADELVKLLGLEFLM